ncbi:hypothetical protein D3C81_1243590 [compost metagenome]
MRVDTLVLGADGDLGSRTRITGGSHDFDEALGNFRHFNAEKLDQHLRRGARQNQLWATVFGANFLEQRTQAHANTEGFARDDVFAGQQGLGVVAQVNDDVVAGNLLDGTGDDLANALAVGVDHLRALGLTDLLHDDLLGGLGGDTTELDGLDLLFDHVTDLGFRVGFVNLAQPGLDRRIIKIGFIDHGPATEGLVATGVAVDFHTQVDFVFKTFFGCSGQGHFQRFENDAGRYTFFVGYRFNNQQYFFAHRTPRLAQAIGPG